MIRILLSRVRQEFSQLSKIQLVRDRNHGIKIGPMARILGDPSNLSIGEGAQIEDGVVFDFRFGGSITLGRNAQIRSGAILAPFGGSIRAGDECGFNHYTVIYGHGGVTIGNFVRIAAHCLVIPANHGFAKIDTPIHRQSLTTKGIVIGNDVWIGGQCSILDGANIGDGSVIAAGSVVIKDIEPFTVAAGTPAKTLRQR